MAKPSAIDLLDALNNIGVLLEASEILRMHKNAQCASEITIFISEYIIKTVKNNGNNEVKNEAINVSR